MSFDLYLFAREPSGFDQARFKSLFADRARYEISDDQAIYQNPDTGVYFVFDLVVPDEADHDEQALAEDGRFGVPHVSFSLNYFRPDFFALEAANELSTLLGDGSLEIFDPQVDGMKGDRFELDGFLSGWRQGNSFAHRAILEREPHRPPTLPRAQNEAVWRWNYERAELQQQLGDDDVFVPMIMLLRDEQDNIRRAFAWTYSVPTVVPRAADSAIVVAPPKRAGLFGRLVGTPDGKAEPQGIASLTDLSGIGTPLPSEPELRFLEAIQVQPPKSALATIKPDSRLSTDSVLDLETVEEALASD